MKTVYIKKGNVHGIYQREPHSTSYAASLLLWQMYTKLENEAYTNMSDNDFSKLPQSLHKNWKIRLAFNTNFLRKQLEKEGVLTCVYCGKSNLIIDSASKHNLATADHFNPVSKGGKAFDEANVVVACFHCNNKKEDRIGVIDNHGNYSF